MFTFKLSFAIALMIQLTVRGQYHTLLLTEGSTRFFSIRFPYPHFESGHNLIRGEHITFDTRTALPYVHVNFNKDAQNLCCWDE